MKGEIDRERERDKRERGEAQKVAKKKVHKFLTL